MPRREAQPARWPVPAGSDSRPEDAADARCGVAPSASAPVPAILHGYSIVRVSLNDHGDRTVAVGVVAWERPKGWYGQRWLDGDEELPGVDAVTRRLMRITRDQIERWAVRGVSPTSPIPRNRRAPASGRLFRRSFLRLCRLDPPKAMAPMVNPDAELEGLFEVVVRPGSLRPVSRRVATVPLAVPAHDRRP